MTKAKIDAKFLKDDDTEAYEVLRVLSLLTIARGYAEVIADFFDYPNLDRGAHIIDRKLRLLGQLGLAEQAPVRWQNEGGSITSRNWKITEAGRECLRLHKGREAR